MRQRVAFGVGIFVAENRRLIAVFEGVIGDIGNIIVNLNSRKRAAAAESELPYRLNRVGNHNAVERRALIKRLAGNFGYSIRNRQSFNRGAALKGSETDARNTIAKLKLLKSGTAVKRAHAYCFKVNRVIKRYGGNASVLVKRVVVNQSNVRVKQLSRDINLLRTVVVAVNNCLAVRVDIKRESVKSDVRSGAGAYCRNNKHHKQQRAKFNENFHTRTSLPVPLIISAGIRRNVRIGLVNMRRIMLPA